VAGGDYWRDLGASLSALFGSLLALAGAASCKSAPQRFTLDLPFEVETALLDCSSINEPWPVGYAGPDCIIAAPRISMHKLIRAVINTIGDDIGRLSTFRETLAQLPPCPTPIDRSHSVAFRDIVAWHGWGGYGCDSHGEGPGIVRGWKHTRWGYESQSAPLLADFGVTSVVDSWWCEIQDVHGLSASKSELSDFDSLDDLVETNSREMIRCIDQAWLDKNLAHDQIRILRSPSNDCFSRYQWDGRIYLLNSGGSHHFSAARYIAKRIGVEVPLTGPLHEHSLNSAVVQDVTSRFEILAAPQDWPPHHSLHDLMRVNGVSYYWKFLPKPWETYRAIFLAKNEPRALRMAGLLKDKGLLDVGASLSTILSQQLSFRQRHDIDGVRPRLPGHGASQRH